MGSPEIVGIVLLFRGRSPPLLGHPYGKHFGPPVTKGRSRPHPLSRGREFSTGPMRILNRRLQSSCDMFGRA
jgi:hypothetical protein